MRAARISFHGHIFFFFESIACGDHLYIKYFQNVLVVI